MQNFYAIPDDPYLRDLIRKIARPTESLDALVKAIYWYQRFGSNYCATLANFEIQALSFAPMSNDVTNCHAALLRLGIMTCQYCIIITNNSYDPHCSCLGTKYFHTINLSQNEFAYKPGLFEEFEEEIITTRFDNIANRIYDKI